MSSNIKHKTSKSLYSNLSSIKSNSIKPQSIATSRVEYDKNKNTSTDKNGKKSSSLNPTRNASIGNNTTSINSQRPKTGEIINKANTTNTNTLKQISKIPIPNNLTQKTNQVNSTNKSKYPVINPLKSIQENILNHMKVPSMNLNSTRTKTPFTLSSSMQMQNQKILKANKNYLNNSLDQNKTRKYGAIDSSSNNSFEKSYGSNRSEDKTLKFLKGKIPNSKQSTISNKDKVIENRKSKISSVSESKSKSPKDKQTNLNSVTKISKNKPNSLLKQYEDNKKRSISPVGNNLLFKNKDKEVSTPTTVSKNNSKNDTLNISKGEEKLPSKNTVRTIQRTKHHTKMVLLKQNDQEHKTAKAEKLVDMDMNSNYIEKKINVDFRENNTSPFVIRKKNNQENENLNQSLIKNTTNNVASLVQAKFYPIKNSNNSVFSKKIKQIHELSKIGYAGSGVKKVNQDNYFIIKNFNDDIDSIFMSVCDGHGLYGHEVSGYLKVNLPLNMNNEFRERKVKYGDKFNINKAIENVFLSTNCRLFNDTTIDTNFSGSTCVSIIYTTEKLVCANVGDSRAVLGRYVNGIWTSHNLSRDHKPNEKEEALRIKRRGGRIEPYRDENDEFIGPPRVWLKTEEVPGLAMTRSFGDQIAASVGILAEPEITEWNFSNEDKFLILASDGIWEFIDSEECINIIKDFYLKNDIQGACDFLINESTKRWMAEEENVIDDTTLIMVFFE